MLVHFIPQNNVNLVQSSKFTSKKPTEHAKFEYASDSFEKSDYKQNKSNNNKFDFSECAKNFAKGLLSPLTAIIKHPVITLGTVALTVAACSLVPVLGPIMAVGFGALSAFQIGKGFYNVAKNIKNKDYDKAEKSFDEVGQGVIGTVLTALGLKQSARVAKEAKLMSKLNVNSLDSAQKTRIASEVKNMTKLESLKEITSLFTSKNGLKAIGAQFKPSNIITRGKEALKFLFTKEEVTKIKKEQMKFTETTEGKRRANLTSEEIESEVKSLYKEAFDEYGVPEELRPEIKIIKDDIKRGGGYSSNKHTIEINETAYREGVFDLPDVIKHEATHAKEAILVQRLPQEEKEKLAIEYLLNKIKNGEKENIVTGGSFLGAQTMKSPKLNPKLKNDFLKLAQEKLYSSKTYTDEELIAMVKPMVESNPEFVQGFNSADDAIKTMANYAKSHNFRYRLALKQSSGFNTSKIDKSLLPELSEEEKIAAAKSFKDSIDCHESNAANSKFLGLGNDFNQYQFTPEEVLCQQKGNSFEISKLNKQLETLRSQQGYDLAEEARLLDQIKKCELTIEYKTKGQEMYRLYTKLLQNPQNKGLAKLVELAQKELAAIKNEINEIDCLVANDFMGMSAHVQANEYTAYLAKVRPEMSVTLAYPLATTDVVEIVEDNINKNS